MSERLRLATYNVEWFYALFDKQNQLLLDREWSRRWNVRRGDQAEALGLVFQALDADAVMIIEAPDTSPSRDGVAALQTFARHYGLRTHEATIGFANETRQEIALLYDPAKMTVRHAPGGRLGDPDDPRFDETFHMDLDFDTSPDPVLWSKPPLELDVMTTGGTSLKMIGVHAKSKAPRGPQGGPEAMATSIANRRKQLAQCMWLRKRVDQRLEQGESVIVMGDFNDGPGLDGLEELFGKSSVEIVLGENSDARLYDPHADLARSRRRGAQPSTARFETKGEPFINALLDYIMISSDLCACDPHWQIWHPFDHPDCYADPVLREALLTASDHFPVVLDLTLP